MTCAATMADLIPLGSWLPALERDGALRMLGRNSPANGHTARMVGEPGTLRDQIVYARMRLDGTDVRASVGRAHSGELACLCTCRDFAQEPPCDHVAGLLLALASSPEMRQRLVRQAARGAAGDSPLPDLPRALTAARRQGIDLEAARASAPGRTGLLDTTFAAWRRRGALRPLGAASFLVGVERGDADEDFDAKPFLRVRVLPAGERTPFGPDDLGGRRLPAHEWRLFEPLSRAPDGAREFVAISDQATVFLERVAAAGAVLHDATGCDTLAVLDDPVRPAVHLRPANDDDVRANALLEMRAAEFEEEQHKLRLAWLEYNAEQQAQLDLPDFRALLGLPAIDDVAGGRDGAHVLEATWRPTRGTGVAAEGAPVPFRDAILLRGPVSWVYFVDGRCFARVASDVGPIALARLETHPQVLVERDDLGRLPALLHEHFQSEGIALPTRADLGLPPLPTPKIVLRVTGSTFLVDATLEATYGEHRMILTPQNAATIEQHERNAEHERAALDLLAGTVLRLAARRGRGRRSAPTEADASTWRAAGDDAVFFWTRDLPRLVGEASANGTLSEVVVPPALRNVTARPTLAAALSAEVAPRSTILVGLRYAADGIPADVEEIRQALAAKRRWVRLTDGSVAELSQRVAALVSATQDTLGTETTAELPRHVLGEVASWSELAEHVALDERLTGWTHRLRELAASAVPEEIPGLVGDLRSYQKVGVAWLQFLSELGAGGILADDMGLGKTIQTLAVLEWRRARDGRMPSLVVAPTSVAPNWIREAERFVPGLKCILLHGLGRHAHYEGVPEADIVVTTYALLRRDVERLRDIRFRYVILDEAQQIKNHAAATTAAAKSLHAEARLALTGTPIENRLLELWSILDFVNPGMLGGWRSFSRRHERPVVAALAGVPTAADLDPDLEEDATDDSWVAQAAFDEAAGLRARIRPFVLRRNKAEVESDLPPKIETDVIVELKPAQHRAYAALIAATREDVARRIAQDGFERNRMVVLTALLRLRQMACDPRLVDPRYRPRDSAKLEAFRELVSEVVASGRRALVFSQFVELLTLLRADLDANGVPYAYLDGRTRDRAAVLRAFTEGTMPLFLLSLRAGGTGVNLTAADVVIHLDPWWNPAVEEQATDRAHRIGQRKTVSVYRIIAAGTIEEAILRLKRQKRALASSVIDDDRGWMKQLTESDITELLMAT
ncbi:MAG: DEAD/DEAH box helicase [Deltaproteobacteria bacterium]|nr:DEAD/DEAH box helicase [Deltaproteobacteria bacterium]